MFTLEAEGFAESGVRLVYDAATVTLGGVGGGPRSDPWRGWSGGAEEPSRSLPDLRRGGNGGLNE